jgi:hypothetical protein
MTAIYSAHNADPIDKLKGIHTRQAEWDAKLYRNTTEKLHSILADCLDVYVHLRGRDMTKKRALLQQELISLGLASRPDLDLAVKIARYVFRLAGGRTATYGRVIRLAVADDQTSKTFPDWLKAHGGIEEVRLKHKSNHMTPTELAQEVSDLLADIDAITQLDVLVDELAPSDEATYSYSLALIRFNERLGKQEVVWGLNNSTLVRNYLVKIESDVRQRCAANTEQQVLEYQRAAVAEAAAQVEPKVALVPLPASGTVGFQISPALMATTTTVNT